MKTRKVEIDAWIDRESTQTKWRLSDEPSTGKFAMIPCKITFEIPIPERKVEISKSMIEETWEEYRDGGHTLFVNFLEFFKDKYFPEDE